MVGLMIESHIDPDEALSDAQQQITPQKLEELLGELKVRKSKVESPEFSSQLEELRKVIDDIDAELLEKFLQRMQLVEQIGEYKQENNVTILQLERWKEILNSRVQRGKEIGLKEDFIRKLLQLIHKESIRMQTEVMNRQPAD